MNVVTTSGAKEPICKLSCLGGVFHNNRHNIAHSICKLFNHKFEMQKPQYRFLAANIKTQICR